MPPTPLMPFSHVRIRPEMNVPASRTLTGLKSVRSVLAIRIFHVGLRAEIMFFLTEVYSLDFRSLPTVISSDFAHTCKSLPPSGALMCASDMAYEQVTGTLVYNVIPEGSASSTTCV